VRYYLDTSALVKLYTQEDGTAAMLDLLGDGDHTVVVLALTRVEVHAALARRLRSNEVTAEQFQEVTDRWAEHWYSHFLVQPVTDALLNERSTCWSVIRCQPTMPFNSQVVWYAVLELPNLLFSFVPTTV
jgi:predicted nucleic acid-binding protein